MNVARAEYTALRRVYEAARRVLRFNGVDGRRTMEAIAELDDSIEEVKQIDGGYGPSKDFEDTQPMQR